MEGILHGYSVNEPTWFYLSLLLIVAVFFRFNRIWSLRNLDLILLLGISPGLLLADESPALGYGWLFVGTGLLLLRLFLDSFFKRRPPLEQNLNTYGLTFLCVASFGFQVTNVMHQPAPVSSVETVRGAEEILQMQDASGRESQEKDAGAGPATRLLVAPVVPTSKLVAADQNSIDPAGFEQVAARIFAVLAHLAAAFGLVMVGRLHFGGNQIGIAMATLYLLLPCTAYDVARVNHVLPAALIVWAFVAYRRPMIAGSLLGLACGSMFFPVFLLPLWAMFYGRRGALKFGLALIIVGAVVSSTFIFTSSDVRSFVDQTRGSINWSALQLRGSDADGFWSTHDAAYRWPVVAGFLVMLVALTVLPFKKTLEHLISHSTAIIVGTQLWYPQQGGAYLLWYLPLMLMVVFRPRLIQLVPPETESTETNGNTVDEPATRAVAMSAASAVRRFR